MTPMGESQLPERLDIAIELDHRRERYSPYLLVTISAGHPAQVCRASGNKVLRQLPQSVVIVARKRGDAPGRLHCNSRKRPAIHTDPGTADASDEVHRSGFKNRFSQTLPVLGFARVARSR